MYGRHKHTKIQLVYGRHKHTKIQLVYGRHKHTKIQLVYGRHTILCFVIGSNTTYPPGWLGKLVNILILLMKGDYLHFSVASFTYIFLVYII